MNKDTQQELLLREEQMIIEYIEELRGQIADYEGDLTILRKQMADFEEGKNKRAWETYGKLIDGELS